VTWLPKTVPGDTPLDRVLGLRPELRDDLHAFTTGLWASGVDPTILELCRLRIAQLLRCESALLERRVPDVMLTMLPQWPTSPLFDGRQRACLAFAEAFVMDPRSATDEQAAAVTAHLGAAGMVAFTEALAIFDGVARLRLTLDV
jgi:alkylhydroperoxidase family enzyme